MSKFIMIDAVGSHVELVLRHYYTHMLVMVLSIKLR